MKNSEIYDQYGDIKGFPSTSVILAVIGAVIFIYGSVGYGFGNFDFGAVSDFYSRAALILFLIPLSLFIVAKTLHRTGFTFAACAIGMVFYITLLFNLLAIYFCATHLPSQPDNHLGWAYLGCSLFIGGISGVLTKRTFPITPEKNPTEDKIDSDSDSSIQ